MMRLEGEPRCGQASRDTVQQVVRQVYHPFADPALGMEVSPAGDIGRQVVGGRAPPGVHMSDYTDLGQGLQGSVHSGAVHARREFEHPRPHLFRVQMIRGCRQHPDHRAPGRGHPLAVSAQDRQGAVTQV